MTPGLKLRRIPPDIDVVELSGRLNLGNTLLSIETTVRRMIREGARKLVIDVSELGYTDSAGIGMFIGVNAEMEQAGGQIRIAGASGLLAKTFGMVHLERIIPLDANIEAACGGLTKDAAAGA